jgi:hypothetical protein
MTYYGGWLVSQSPVDIRQQQQSERAALISRQRHEASSETVTDLTRMPAPEVVSLSGEWQLQRESG